jgi:phospholipase C
MKRVAAALALLLPAAAYGCSVGTDDTSSSDENLGVAVADWDRPVTRPASDALAAQNRSMCQYKRGSMPAETLGAELPVDGEIPIKTIVVLMQENRSFDSYFGHMNQYAHRTDIESASEATAANPEQINTASSPMHGWKHAPMLCFADTDHEWGAVHRQYNNGKMDGFFQTNVGQTEGEKPNYGVKITVDGKQVDPLTGDRAMWWYDQSDIPFYYSLASTFAMADHYHSSILGPTYPNRDYLYAASSYGVTSNDYPDQRKAGPENNVIIFDELQKRGISWAVYVDGWPHIPRLAAFMGPDVFGGYNSRWPGDHIKDTGDFKDAAKKGQLPQVVFLDGNITEDVINGNDDHPPGDIQQGQKYVSDRVHDLMSSPQWKELALFITWDEHGGIYDHVPPPRACAPDGLAPNITNSADQVAGGFDQYGVRVPFIAVSPFAKKNYVSHHTYDHTSITRFIETKFKLPAMSWRDANADPLLDVFDFKNPPFMNPPALAQATVDSDRYRDCETLFVQNQGKGGHN